MQDLSHMEILASSLVEVVVLVVVLIQLLVVAAVEPLVDLVNPYRDLVVKVARNLLVVLVLTHLLLNQELDLHLKVVTVVVAVVVVIMVVVVVAMLVHTLLVEVADQDTLVDIQIYQSQMQV